jgi:hypothetical protein
MLPVRCALILFGALLVVSLVATAAVSGDLDASFVCDVGADVWDLEGELTIGAANGEWEVAADIDVDASVWERLDVDGSIDLGNRGAAATVRWDPSRCVFYKLALDGWLTLGRFEFDVEFDLYATRCWTDLGIECEIGGCEIDIEVRLGASKAFCLDFYRLDTELSFETCGIPIDIESRVSAKKGFERIDVETILPLPATLSWLAVEVEARWTVAGRECSFEPELDVEAVWEDGSVSLELFGDVISSDPLELRGLTIVGLCFEGDWDDLWFEWGTSFDAAWNKTVTGEKAYGQVVALGCEVRGPCDWEMSVELECCTVAPSTFPGWDRTTLSLSTQPVDSRSFDVGISLDVSGLLEIAFGLGIEW